MPPPFRIEYHWIAGNLIPRTSYRPPGAKRWQKPRIKPPTLVAIIEPTARGIEVFEGDAADPSLLARAVCSFYGYDVDQLSRVPEIGAQVPPELILRATRHIAKLVEDVTDKFRSLAG